MTDEQQSPAARFAADMTRAHDDYRAARAARSPEQAADDRADDALDAVIRAATGDGVTEQRTAARVEHLAADWPELAGALAALLHSEGLEVPQRWLSMDVRRWSPEA